MKNLGVRDVYNLVVGKAGTGVIDIRSAPDFTKSHIVNAENFVESNYSSIDPPALFGKITTQLKKIFAQTFNYTVFVGDGPSIQNFNKINEAFKGSKYKNIFFLETPFDTFRSQYSWVCHDNFFLPNVSEFPCEILPNLFLGQCPPSRSRDLTEKYFTAIGITNVVNITADCNYIVPKSVTPFQIKVNDEKYEELPLENIIEFVEKALSSNPTASSSSSSSSSSASPPSARVLVHCRQGISRSATAVTSYVLWKHRISVRQALTVVKTQRAVVQPIIDFLRQLYCFEDKLGIVDMENKYGKGPTPGAQPTPFNIRTFTFIPPAQVSLIGVFHSGSMRAYTSKK